MHFAMERRAHRVLLLRPVEPDRGDAVLLLDQDGFVVRHCFPPCDGNPAATTAYRTLRTMRASAMRSTSTAPSVIIMLRWSRKKRSIGSSLDRPMPPWIWITRSAAQKERSSPKIFTMKASARQSSPRSYFHAA